MQTRPLPRPRWTLLAAGLLVAAALPAFGPAAPALAFEACTSDDKAQQEEPSSAGNPLSGDSGTCDDITPPDTRITKMTPEPNRFGLLKTGDVAFEFEVVVSDDDPGPWTFKCRISTAPNVAEFEDCGGTGQPGVTKGTYTKSGLGDTLNGHTFEVYAVDAHDKPVNYTHSEFGVLGPETTYTEDEAAFPDDDRKSPAKMSWKQDTQAPTTLIRNPPYEEITVDGDTSAVPFPMVDTANLKVNLDSSEGSTEAPIDFSCRLDKKQVPCQQGVFTLKQLSPGDHRFEAVAVDRAGNASKNPATMRFSVPSNLKAAKGWTRRKEGGYFARDFLQSTKVGATVSVAADKVRELRLIAPKGPNLGKVEVRIGSGIWRTVNLHGKTYERFHVYFVRDQFDPLVSGRIFVRVKSVPEFGFARVDAVLGH